MVKTLSPAQAQALIAQGDVDILDVRDPRDWASGHVPGARSLPLDELRGGAASKLGDGDRTLLFVCARGVRSQTAAQLAEDAGKTSVHSLAGGMLEWAAAGLPIETAAPAASPAAPASSGTSGSSVDAPPPSLPPGAPRAASPTSPPPASHGAPLDATAEPAEPALDTVVGDNLRVLRTARKLSLDLLARLTGLSRSLLGQIELGKVSPSVAVVWKLARAFDVPFSVMLATAQPTAISVLRAKGAKRIVGNDGKFSSRALFPLGTEPDAELYELTLAPYSREDAHPHQPGTRENLVVAAGRLELTVGAEHFTLTKGDAIVFGADVPHSYENPDRDECWIYLVMTYGRRTPDAVTAQRGRSEEA
jgi:rhodanese-related sulfurtransferase/transcriptional regulator with XRE-family HTH domain